MSVSGGMRRDGASAVAWPRLLLARIGWLVALLIRRPPQHAHAPRRSHGYMLAGVAVLLAAATGTAMLWLDARALAAVGRLPPRLVEGFDMITDFGKSGWFLWPTGLLLLAIGAGARRDLPTRVRAVLAAIAVRLAFLFLAIGLPGLVVSVLKRMIGRARPLVEGEGVVIAFRPFDWRVEYASMPSGHGTTAFAAAIAVGALWPALRPLMWTYALLIGASRVAVTAHYPSDIIASAAFGAIGAILVRDWFAARRLAFAVGTDGAVRRLPGPSWRRMKEVARRLLSA